jgi:hypothetical protein
VRKPDSERASAVLPTQAEAIAWAKEHNPKATPTIERVRNTKDGHPDKWRNPWSNRAALLLSTGLHNLRFLGIALDGLALGIAVVIATFFGPVLAVLVTRCIDNKRQARDRRLDTFRALMASRRALLSPDAVRALSLIEIDFYGIEPVENAHREVMTDINTPRPLPAGWDDRLRKLLTKLLSEMAKVLSYNLQHRGFP